MVNSELEMLQIKMLKDRNLDLRGYDREKFRNSIQKRLAANNLTSYTEYMGLLDRQPDEYGQLFNELLVDRYDFFYDSEALEALEKNILPAIIARKRKGDPIRIWSPSCAEGAEPYSVGILVADTLGDAIYDYDLRIYASDPNGNEISKARKGIYPIHKLKNVEKQYLEKYFIPEDTSLMVRTDIRQRVVFSTENLTVDAPLYNIDLIMYRYSLIYYNLEQQNNVLAKLYFALNSGGYALFGRHETTPLGSKLFKPVNVGLKIFQRAPAAISAFPGTEMRKAMEDILIEKAAREAKRELEAMDLYNRAIIQNLNFGLIVINNNKIVTHWNHAIGEIWLMRPEDAVGRNFFELGMNERLPGIRERIQEVAKYRRTVRIDGLEVTDYTGKKRYLDVVITPLVDPNGEVRGTIITCSEAAGSREDRESLKKSNEELEARAMELAAVKEEQKSINEELGAVMDELRYRTEQLHSTELYDKAITQNINQGLIILDKNYNVTAWNPAAQRMWGIKEKDAIGKTVFTLIKAEGLRQRIEQAVERGTIREEALEYTAPSGEKRLTKLTVIPLIDTVGKSQVTMLLAQDITERRRKD